VDLVVTEMLTGGETHVRASVHMNAELDQIGSDSDYLRSEFEIEKSPCGSRYDVAGALRPIMCTRRDDCRIHLCIRVGSPHPAS
jgi:hypothetical protein